MLFSTSRTECTLIFLNILFCLTLELNPCGSYPHPLSIIEDDNDQQIYSRCAQLKRGASIVMADIYYHFPTTLAVSLFRGKLKE